MSEDAIEVFQDELRTMLDRGLRKGDEIIISRLVERLIVERVSQLRRELIPEVS